MIANKPQGERIGEMKGPGGKCRENKGDLAMQRDERPLTLYHLQVTLFLLEITY